MSSVKIDGRSATTKAAWLVLLAISLLSVVSYVILIFVVPVMIDSFIAWATFSLYSAVVLLIPYRRGERWSWYLTCVLPLPHVVLGLNNPDAAPYYLAAAGLIVISQVLTRGAFFTKA